VLSEAVAETATLLPVTVAPPLGAVIATVGAVVSATALMVTPQMTWEPSSEFVAQLLRLATEARSVLKA
jgi:hypothetical protein